MQSRSGISTEPAQEATEAAGTHGRVAANPSAVNIVANIATCVKIKTGHARFAPTSGG